MNISNLFRISRKTKKIKRVKDLPNPDAPLLFWIIASIPDYFFGFIELGQTTLGDQIKYTSVEIDPKDPGGTMVALCSYGKKLKLVEFISLSEIAATAPDYKRAVYTPEKFSEEMMRIKENLTEQQRILNKMQDLLADFRKL